MTEQKGHKELPKGWKWVKLREYVVSSKGKKPKRISKEKTKECPIPYVNIKAFEKGVIDEYTDGVGCVLCNDGDFLMVWDGSRSGYVGKGIKGALGSTLVKLDFPDIENNYAYYFLQSKFLDINTRAKGVGIPHVDPNILWNYKLLIPPKSSQLAIVSKIEELFSELDKGIEQIKTAQQQLKTYRQSVLKWAFEGKLARSLNHDSFDFHDENDLNKKNHGNQINHKNHSADKGELPEGWKQIQIKDVAETYGGYAFKSGEFKKQGKFQVIRMGNVRPGILRYDESPVFLDSVDENVLSRSLLKVDDIIITQTGTRKKRDYGFTVLIPKDNLLLNQRIAAIRFKKNYLPKFFLYFSWTDLFKDQFFANETGNVGQGNVGMKAVTETVIPFCSIEEQNIIVQEIESRLSVADKMEESINQSLQQAEALRQSILKKAFEGRLIAETMQPAAYKPKNEYFFDCQILAYILRASKKRNIRHGEMTLAKYAYLAVKIFGIPLSYVFQQWHLGPYPPEIKKAVNNKQFFQHTKYGLDLANEEKLIKYNNPYQQKTEEAVNEIVAIFDKYDSKARLHKTELLATVCKAIEDSESTDFTSIREVMKKWKIDLKNSPFKNKAEKFDEIETRQCLSFIISKGWDLKLVNY